MNLMELLQMLVMMILFSHWISMLTNQNLSVVLLIASKTILLNFEKNLKEIVVISY